MTEGHQLFENLEQDSLRSLKNGSGLENAEIHKVRSFRKVGSDRSLQSAVSGSILITLVIFTFIPLPVLALFLQCIESRGAPPNPKKMLAISGYHKAKS